jgi:hypothetical protein
MYFLPNYFFEVIAMNRPSSLCLIWFSCASVLSSLAEASSSVSCVGTAGGHIVSVLIEPTAITPVQVGPTLYEFNGIAEFILASKSAVKLRGLFGKTDAIDPTDGSRTHNIHIDFVRDQWGRQPSLEVDLLKPIPNKPGFYEGGLSWAEALMKGVQSFEALVCQVPN